MFLQFTMWLKIMIFNHQDNSLINLNHIRGMQNIMLGELFLFLKTNGLFIAI